MTLDLTGIASNITANSQIRKSVADPSPSVQDQAPVTGTTPDSSAVDRTTFQSGTANVRALVSQALATPEIRQDKVDSIRQSISNGTYKFNAGKVADAMIATAKAY